MLVDSVELMVLFDLLCYIYDWVKNPQPLSLSQRERERETKLTPIKNNVQDYRSGYLNLYIFKQQT